ncbi:hypothetical protein ENBRE01_3405 [Enteropsectra breve]|nr:hypothetical protein ENBRE01_3405 [Enteropsectra breve]
MALCYFREFWKGNTEKWIQETIIFSEILKYKLSWLFGSMGHWHEYTLVETTNWHWSFEKNTEGIFVQRSKNKKYVRGEGRNIEGT